MHGHCQMRLDLMSRQTERQMRNALYSRVGCFWYYVVSFLKQKMQSLPMVWLAYFCSYLNPVQYDIPLEQITEYTGSVVKGLLERRKGYMIW